MMLKKYLKVLIMVGILILFDGAVSAGENKTVDEFENQIQNVGENDTVFLEGGTYDFSPKNSTNETHILINKSVSFQGSDKKTVIDGNNSNLYFDTVEEDLPTDELIIVVYPESPFKENGKHLIFSNITFKNINIFTWHEMEFRGCTFINSAVTSYQLDNRFDDCEFQQSGFNIGVFISGSSLSNSTVRNCIFNDSQIGVLYLGEAFHLSGSTPFYQSINLIIADTEFLNSRINAYSFNVTVNDSKFSNSSISGSSNRFNMVDSEFSDINFSSDYSKICLQKSAVNNLNMTLKGVYYSSGSDLVLKNTTLSNSTVLVTYRFYSRKSHVNITDSVMDNVNMEFEDADVNIDASQLIYSNITLMLSSLNMKKSDIYSDNPLNETIRTKTEKTDEIYSDDGYVNMTTIFLFETDYDFEESYLINGSDRYLISGSDLNFNTFNKLIFDSNKVYRIGEEITITILDYKNRPYANRTVEINEDGNFHDSSKYQRLATDENGNIRYKLTKEGKTNIYIKYEFLHLHWIASYYPEDVLTVHVIASDFKMECPNLSYEYGAGKSLKIRLVGNEHDDLSDIKISVKLPDKTEHQITTDNNNVAVFKLPKLNAGKYKLEISTINGEKITAHVKINKVKTVVKISKAAKKSLKIKIKSKTTKKAVKKVKIKVKVFTGAKYKIYNLKTDKNGVCKLKIRSSGRHKLVITSKNKNYKISSKKMVRIK